MTGTLGRAANVATSPSREAAVDGLGGATAGVAVRPSVMATGAASGATQVKPRGVVLRPAA